MKGKVINMANILKSVLLALVLSIILTAIAAVFVCFMNVSDRTVANLIFAVSAVSVLAAAFVLAKNSEQRGLLNGLLLGIGYFAVLAVLSLIINGGVEFGSQLFLRCFATLAAGMLGGVLGINATSTKG